MVQEKAEYLPTVDPSHIPIQPFSPPATPSRSAPPLGKNPFISDAFVNLPARRFREGDFDNFYGDPFESIEVLPKPPSSHDDMYTEDIPTPQQFLVNTGSVESISQESQASQSCSHSSGMENEDPESSEQHDYHMLEDPNQATDQAHFAEQMTTSQHPDVELSSHDLSQNSSVTESGSEKSSPNSKRSGRSKKSKSSVESLQDVVVTEREEPVLQVSK